MNFTKQITITINRDSAMRYVMENFGEFVNYMAKHAPYDFWNFFDERNDDLIAWIKKGGLDDDAV